MVPVVVSVSALAPLVVRLPASVIVFPPLFTPVPPYTAESVEVETNRVPSYASG